LMKCGAEDVRSSAVGMVTRKPSPLEEIRSLSVSKYWKLAIGAAVSLVAIMIGGNIVQHARASSAQADKQEVGAPSGVHETAEQRIAEIRKLAASPEPEAPANPVSVAVTRTPAPAVDGTLEVSSKPSGAAVEIEGVAGQSGQ